MYNGHAFMMCNECAGDFEQFLEQQLEQNKVCITASFNRALLFDDHLPHYHTHLHTYCMRTDSLLLSTSPLFLVLPPFITKLVLIGQGSSPSCEKERGLLDLE